MAFVAADETADLDAFTYPVFVKPARSASSFGVSKVTRKEELRGAVESARRYEGKVLIEAAVVGSEIGCAILGDELDLVAGEVGQRPPHRLVGSGAARGLVRTARPPAPARRCGTASAR